MTSKSSRPDKEEEEEKGRLLPIDLARGYATLAFELNQRLPRLEKELDETRGIALAAHGLASETRLRIEDIAIAVKAAPAHALIRSIPPPPVTEKLEIKFSPSPTGTHAVLEHHELERLQAKFAEKEAEERGAKEALTKLLADEDLERKRAKAKREFWLFIAAIMGTVAGIVTYALEHIAFKVKP